MYAQEDQECTIHTCTSSVHTHGLCMHMFLAWHILASLFPNKCLYFIYVYKSLRFDNKMILRTRGALPPGVAFHVADVSVVRLVAASPGLLFGCDRQERGHLELQGNQRMRRYIFISPIIEYHIIYVKKKIVKWTKKVNFQWRDANSLDINPQVIPSM